MRLPVEWIREYVPLDEAQAGAEAIADRLTMAGLEVEEKAESARGPVLDIKVTPNRGDCLSVVGVARELSAAYAVPLAPPRPPILGGAAPLAPSSGGASAEGETGRQGDKETRRQGDQPSALNPQPSTLNTSVTIEAPDLCPRYAARIVRGLTVGPSPQWMQERLEAAGMRPINNIVDVTNYVMLETGQPLHAFDYDTLAEHRIVVRRARPGERIMTLDGTERALTPEMLVIADARKAVAVAGVMGGAETEMSAKTTTLLLESAHFDALSVRRTARALEMRTEASYRFERVVDPAMVAAAADRACQLIAELGMGEVVPGIVDVYPAPAEPRVLTVRPERVSAMLGFRVRTEQVIDTLQRLGFTLEDSTIAPASGSANGGAPAASGMRCNWCGLDSTDPETCSWCGKPLSDLPRVGVRVTSTLGASKGPRSVRQAVGRGEELAFIVPSWRPDIVRETDLVEEVGRVLGYEHIPETLPKGASTQGSDSQWGRFAERVRGILVGEGLQEVVTHTLLAESDLEDARAADRRVAIRSALSAELSGLRRSLLPGLLETVERNARRGLGPLAFFEVGHIFHRSAAPGGDEYEETTAIGGALAGPLTRPGWQRETPPAPGDYYTIRGIIERLALGLRVPALTFEPGDDPRLHPGRQAAIRLNDLPVGYAGELHPRLAADLTTRERVVVFELWFPALELAASAPPRFAPLSPYPSVVRDLAPRVAKDVPYARVEAAIGSAGAETLQSYRLTDVFSGAPLPEGQKSLTLSFTFRAPDRTLTEADVNDALARLRAALEAECGAAFAG